MSEEIRTWGVEDRFEAIEECEWQMVERKDYDTLKSELSAKDAKIAKLELKLAEAKVKLNLYKPWYKRILRGIK